VAVPRRRVDVPLRALHDLGAQPGQKEVRRRRRSKTATWTTAVDGTHNVENIVGALPG